MGFDVGLDLFPLLAASLAAVCCALLGNFLVLRNLSLMGDAISHSVLPGLVIAFILASSRNPVVMFLGAAASGVGTVVLVEAIKRIGRVESGAAMGVVFSVLFALGVLLIENAAGRHVDLDADCVLHGQLETLVWFGAPSGWGGVFSLETLRNTPRQVWTLLGMTLGAGVFVAALFKELRLASFDPALSTTLGFHAGVLHYALMILVAGATVASFEAVGSILVVAMLICPAASARLLTDRLSRQIWISLAFAVGASLLGYAGATVVPGWFGKDSVNAAGSIAVMSGVLLVGAIVLSPSHGVLAKRRRHTRLARSVERDDLIATLYRANERGEESVSNTALAEALPAARLMRAIGDARRAGLIEGEAGGWLLTETGRDAAADIVRRHRLWESYLVNVAHLDPEHVHDTAERLEHLGIGPAAGPETDPHGKPIP